MDIDKLNIMKKITFLFFIFYTFQVSAQKIRPEIKNLVEKIEKHNQLESKHVGIAGIITDQYLNFEKLKKKATTAELLELLNHKNNVVKGYSSWALVDNKYPKLVTIFSKFLETEEKVTAQDGCIVSDEELSDEFYYRIFYQHFKNKISEQDSLFFLAQIKQLDSVILYKEKETSLLSNALENNNANPKTYQRIKHLALKVKNIEAIKALAIYQKKEDIPEFKKLGKLAFFAIANFPDIAFWDFLLSYQSNPNSEEYFLAVAAFKTETSAKLLNDILTSSKEKPTRNFCEAITKNYCIHYQSLLLYIWENYKVIDIRATQYLINDILKRASISFVNGLLLDKKPVFFEYDYDYGQSELILPLIFENIKEYQKEKLLSICLSNIHNTSFTILNQFLTLIKDSQLKETSEVLFKKLEQQNYAFEIFYLTETILSFKNINNKERIVTILKNKQKNWDRGNWAEHFRKTFKEYGIVFD